MADRELSPRTTGGKCGLLLDLLKRGCSVGPVQRYSRRRE
jgi:hypothetical protein